MGFTMHFSFYGQTFYNLKEPIGTRQRFPAMTTISNCNLISCVGKSVQYPSMMQVVIHFSLKIFLCKT